MKKPPPAPPPPVPEPPAHLSERSQELWRAVVPRRARGPERLALLTVALEALDRAEAARVAIERDGMMVVNQTTNMPHAHPMLKAEKDARGTFLAAWRELGLSVGGDRD